MAAETGSTGPEKAGGSPQPRRVTVAKTRTGTPARRPSGQRPNGQRPVAQGRQPVQTAAPKRRARRWLIPAVVLCVVVAALAVFAVRHNFQRATAVVKARVTGSGYQLVEDQIKQKLQLSNANLITQLAAACNTTSADFTAALHQTSILEACKRTNTHTTASKIVDSIGTFVDQKLQLPVALGLISAQDQSQIDQDLRTSLTTSVTVAPAPQSLVG